MILPPIVQAPNYALPFELLCDASDKAVGAALGQKQGRESHVICYASKTLDVAQCNYTVTEKELYAVVFALEKFRSYLLCLLYTSPSPRDGLLSRMPSSA